MKWKLDRKYTTIAVYALLVIAFAIVLGMVFLNLSSIIRILGIIWEKSLSVLFGIFFTFCFLPVVKLFEKLFGKLLNRSRPHPTLVSLFSAILVDVIVLGILIVAVVGIIPAFLDAYEAFQQNVIPSLTDIGNRLEQSDSSIVTKIYHELKVLISDVFAPDSGSLITSLTTIVADFFSRAYAIAVGMVLATYFLVCRRYLTSISRKLSAALLPEKFRLAAFAVVKRIYYFFVEYFSYRLFSGVAIALLVFLLFLPFRIEYGIIVAGIVFVANFIPVFGPIVATIVCTILIAIFSPPWKAVVAFIILACLQILTSLLIEPFCLRKKLRPGPGIVVTSVIVCYALFGFSGVIFAVPLFSSVDVAYREIQTRLLVRKNLPMNNSFYLNLEELPADPLKQDTMTEEPVSEEHEVPTDETMPSHAPDPGAFDGGADPATEPLSSVSMGEYDLSDQEELSLENGSAPFYPIPDSDQSAPPPRAIPEPEVKSDLFTAPTSLPKPDSTYTPETQSTQKKKSSFFPFFRNKKKK